MRIPRLAGLRSASGAGFVKLCNTLRSAADDLVRSRHSQVCVVECSGASMQRIFIVGCPRSGTTLVQAMLARHPAVLTLPETAFFEQLCGDLKWRWGDRDARPQRRRLRQRLGFAHKRARTMLEALQHRLSCEAARMPWPLRTESCARLFVGLVDSRAQAEGRTAWIEKT